MMHSLWTAGGLASGGVRLRIDLGSASELNAISEPTHTALHAYSNCSEQKETSRSVHGVQYKHRSRSEAVSNPSSSASVFISWGYNTLLMTPTKDSTVNGEKLWTGSASC
ncbi:hypothetical protein [Parapedobacter sp. DT-150]|uniref:hypothetical protein n=1 Tax=Parapedobacter sp. DT-150 TaxID=3396162 RepID=UPI003F1CDF39